MHSNIKEGSEAVLGAFLDAVKLFNDSKYRSQADAVQKKMDAITDRESAEFKELEKRKKLWSKTS
jgi:hypothetical protein